MGYLTIHQLKWRNQNGYKTDNLNKIVGDYIEENNLYGIDCKGEMTDSVKWYESEEDIRVMSEKIPHVLFHLTGKGEEAGDVWDLWALNGKAEKIQARIVRGKFRPSFFGLKSKKKR